MIERTITTSVHGRYLVIPSDTAQPGPMLVGFHGYAEPAEAQIERLLKIPGRERWLLVSVQGLHRFYQRRTNDVVASWMTRQDRELAIADNLAYVSAVVDLAARERDGVTGLVFAGFSQGVAMAFRAAASSTRSVSGVIAVGGDVPPEIETPALQRVGAVLMCRGLRDPWHTAEQFEIDLTRLRGSAVPTRALEFDGEHEWSDEVARTCGEFLKELR